MLMFVLLPMLVVTTRVAQKGDKNGVYTIH